MLVFSMVFPTNSFLASFASLYSYTLVSFPVCTVIFVTVLSSFKSNFGFSTNPKSMLYMLFSATFISAIIAASLVTPFSVIFVSIPSEFKLSSTPCFW